MLVGDLYKFFLTKSAIRYSANVPNITRANDIILQSLNPFSFFFQPSRWEDAQEVHFGVISLKSSSVALQKMLKLVRFAWGAQRAFDA
jgi:hypothetical protein